MPLFAGLDRSIFRAYDVRGRADDNLTADVVYAIGRAFADLARERTGANRVVIGGDGRLSTPRFRKVLATGLTEGGSDVTDIGLAPTPLVYFAGLNLGIDAGIVVTGSHNPSEDNGLKFFFGREPYAGDDLQDLYHLVARGKSGKGHGRVTQASSVEAYVAEFKGGISLTKRFKVAIDTGNGVAGPFARTVFKALGCDVVSIFEEVDGTFPNHHPDPSRPENLVDLVACVQQEEADVGLAFDGDGDRLGVVTNSGERIATDRLIALFATSILRTHRRSPVIFDVKCGHALRHAIELNKGQVVMCATGHTNLKELLRQRNAPLAGEFSGHICFADRWYGFDDACYAGARFIELMDKTGKTAQELFADIPALPSTPELFIETDDEAKFEIIDRLKKSQGFNSGHKTLLDGLRVDYEDGWGLVRASNTSPKLSLRFEAIDEEALSRIRRSFEIELRNIDSKLRIGSH